MNAPTRHPWWALVIAWLALAGHVAVLPLYLSVGLITPLYGVIFFWAVWVALFFVAIWMLRKHPVFTFAVPLVALGVLFSGVALGTALFGWHA